MAFEGIELAVEAWGAFWRSGAAESEGGRFRDKVIRGTVDFVAARLPCRL